MSTDQLKAIVIEKILYERDEATLQGVFEMLSSHSSQTVILTPEQQISVDAGLADLEAGRFVTQEELDQQDDKWL